MYRKRSVKIAMLDFIFLNFIYSFNGSIENC